MPHFLLKRFAVFIFLILGLLGRGDVWGQRNVFHFTEPPKFAQASVYTYVYHIPIDSVYRIAYNGYGRAIDPKEEWLREPAYIIPNGKVDSLMRTKDFPIGYYLTVSAQQNQMQLGLQHSPGFTVHIIDLQHVKVLNITDPTGAEVRDAIVMQGKTVIAYDYIMNGYVVKAFKNDEVISVRKGNDIQFVRGSVENNSDYERPKRRNETSDYDKQNNLYNGYLVTNKPKYLPHDTVKWKAYLQQPYDKNRPSREGVRVTFSQQYGYGNPYYIAKSFKPKEPGVYFGEFVLGDSVKVDQLYTLEVYGTRSGSRITQTFKVEDYLLDEMHLSVKGEGITPYQKGDSVNLYAYAYNSNNLPVLDGQVSITVYPEGYNTTPDHLVFIPDTLYHQIVTVNPNGETDLSFSTKGFPEELYGMRCAVSLFNSNYERKDTSFVLRYSKDERYIRITAEGRKVKAELISNKKSVSGVGTYTTQRAYKYSNAVPITYPYEYTLTDDDYSIQFRMMDKIGLVAAIGTYDVPAVQLSSAEDFVGDTAVLQLYNPLGLRYRYSVYAGNEFVGYGATKRDTLIKVYSKKGKTVTLIGSYAWKGSEVEQRFAIYKMDRELKIDLHKKDLIYPGQKDTISIHLGTRDGKPVEKTNVTVLAFTSQFAEDYTPEVPYGGLIYPAYAARKFRTLTLMQPIYLNAVLANRRWLERCGADTMFFYKNLYLLPDDVAWVMYDIPESAGPQLALYLQMNGGFYQPEIVYVDNNPVYINHTSTTNPAGFFVKEGIHQLSFRMAKASYSIPYLSTCAGMKTDLYLNIDSVGPFYYKDTVRDSVKTYERTNHLRTFVSKYEMPDSLNYYEKDNIAKWLLLYRPEYTPNYRTYYSRINYGAPILQQGLMQIDINQYNRTYYTNSGQQNIYMVGPINFGDSVYFYQQENTKLKFEPERGYIFTFRPQMTRVEKQSIYEYLGYKLGNYGLWPSVSYVAPNPVNLDTLPVMNAVGRDRGFALKGKLERELYYSLKLNTPLIPDSLRNTQIHLYNKPDSAIRYVIFRKLYSKEAPFIGSNFYRNLDMRASAGVYQIIIIWGNHHYSLYDTVTVRANGTTILPINYMNEQGLFTYNIAKAWLRPYVHVDTVINAGNLYYSFDDASIKNEHLTGSYGGGIDGTIRDAKGEEIPSVSVIVYQGDRQMAITGTDLDGRYEAAPLSPGMYDVKFTNMGQEQIITDVQVVAGMYTRINYKFGIGKALSEVNVTSFRKPLISPSGLVTTKTAESIEKLVNQQTTDIVSMGTSVFQQKQGASLIIGGARGTGELVIVDGVQYPSASMGTTNLPVGSVDQIATYSWGTPGKYGDASGGVVNRAAGNADDDFEPGSHYLSAGKTQNFLNAFMGNMMGASGMRKEFRDWAIWEPDLWTNSDGNTSFNVTYPDNTTAWKTYVLAMNRTGYAGKILKLTRAFKPLSAQLSIPRFLRYGDVAEGIGKVANYTKEPFHLHGVYRQGDKVINDDTMVVHNTRVTTLQVTAPTVNVIDTAELQLSYGIVADNGYTDAEEKTIQVLPVGVTETKGQFMYLNGDTSISSTPDLGAGYFTGKSRVYVEGSMLEVMLREIQKLKVDPHGCTEQLTTKLLSIYYEEAIKQLLGDKNFNNTKAKRKILEQLVRAQRQDGSFGWWANNYPDERITNYVVSTMQKINKDGWLDVIIRRGMNYLNNNLSLMNTDNQIASLATLSIGGYAANYKPIMERVDSTRPTMYNRLVMTKIRKEQGLPYRDALDSLVRQRTETMNGIYWGEGYRYDWYRDDLAATLVAYTLIKGDSVYGKMAPAISRYLLFRRSNGYYGSTASGGLVLTTLLPDLLEQKSIPKDRKTTYVKLGGSVKDSITAFPRVYAVNDKNPHFTIDKKGISPVYLSVVYDYFNTSPKPHDSDFTIRTYFVTAKNDTVTELKAGEKVTLRTTLKCKKESEYIMIEVPVPAGCVVVDKNRDYYRYPEAARENFKDQTDIFCNKLDATTYTFDITVESRYKGVYNVSPARASMMYYPEEYGNTGVKVVRVR